MPIDKEKILYQMADVLIQHYGYVLVDVRNIKNELWLSHPTRKKYNLLRCSIESGFQLQHVDARTQQIIEAITTVFQTELSFCDVLVDDGECQEAWVNDTYKVTLAPKGVCDEFHAQFPLLKSIFELKADEDLTSLKTRIQSKPLNKAPKNVFEMFKQLPKATLGVLVFIVLMTLAVNALSWMGYDIYTSAILLGAYYKTLILSHHEYWRFLSAGFIHMDVLHLAMNAMALINLGNFMERLYGPKKLLITLCVGIVTGSLFVFAVEGNVLVVGISGGLYAILGIMMVYLVETGLIRQKAIQSQLMRLVFMNLLINFIPGVSYLGHLGGLLAGILLGLGFAKHKSYKTHRIHAFMALALLMVSLLTMSFINPKREPLYGETDQDIIDMSQELGMSWYSKSVKTALDHYYVEVLELEKN